MITNFFIVQFNFLGLSDVKLPQLSLQVRISLEFDESLRDRGLEGVGFSGTRFEDFRTHLRNANTNNMSELARKLNF